MSFVQFLQNALQVAGGRHFEACRAAQCTKKSLGTVCSACSHFCCLDHVVYRPSAAFAKGVLTGNFKNSPLEPQCVDCVVAQRADELETVKESNEETRQRR